jgi:hypothetical protein
VAIVLFDSDDPDRNTSPPTGAWAGSGWQWQGQWGAFVGTPIAPALFVTAAHVGGAVGDPLVWAGVPYPAVGVFSDPDSDLAIWKICGAFPTFAPMVHTNAPLQNQQCVLFGRGAIRGDAVVATNPPAAGLRGWLWAPGNGRLRWGLNTLDASGPLLQAAFDPGQNPDEATLAAGDSGGALFVLQDRQWRLAGVHYAVDGPFRLHPNLPAFSASLFDERGLEEESSPGQWQAAGDGPEPLPGRFYSTSVAARRGWIDRVIADHGDPGQPVLQAAPAPTGPFATFQEASVGAPGSRAFRIPQSAGARFFRLVHCVPAHIETIRWAGDALELNWSVP